MSIHSNENLARFISSEGWFNQGRVKGDAFRPKRDHRLLKTSVTRHDGESPEEVKRKGEAWVRIRRANPITFFGWADVKAGNVRTASTIPALDIEADLNNKRDPNHANIVGWDIEEGKQMIQAEDVARQSQLVLI